MAEPVHISEVLPALMADIQQRRVLAALQGFYRDRLHSRAERRFYRKRHFARPIVRHGLARTGEPLTGGCFGAASQFHRPVFEKKLGADTENGKIQGRNSGLDLSGKDKIW